MTGEPPLLLDVCGTLYDANTSVAFLSWLARRHPSLGLRWFLGSAHARLRRARGASPGDCMRPRLALLRGRPRQWIRSRAVEFVAMLENDRPHAESIARMDQALRDGRETWLVSATFGEILEAIAGRHPGVRILGSSLAYQGDLCTGRYSEFLLEAGKARALARHLSPERIATAEFATDDLDADADLASAVAHVAHVRMGVWT
jgi:phosphoserine phosphatase